MSQNGAVYYLHGDHLGSTNVVSGAAISQQTHYAYGLPRTSEGTLPTDYAFTGQRQDSYIKLIEMGSRWYDPELSRWTQPDSIIPSIYNPQSLNRYSYVLNNPVKYTDPTGHRACGDGEDEDCNGRVTTLDEKIQGIHDTYDVIVEKGFSRKQLDVIIDALWAFAGKAEGTVAARRAIGGVRVVYDRNRVQVETAGNTIYVNEEHFHQTGFRKELGPAIGIGHELAHAWDNLSSCSIADCGFGTNAISFRFEFARGGEQPVTDYGSRGGYIEDWAETVATFVYPEYADILKKENNPAEMVGLGPGLNQRPWHLDFVTRQFRGLW